MRRFMVMAACCFVLLCVVPQGAVAGDWGIIFNLGGCGYWGSDYYYSSGYCAGNGGFYTGYYSAAPYYWGSYPGCYPLYGGPLYSSYSYPSYYSYPGYGYPGYRYPGYGYPGCGYPGYGYGGGWGSYGYRPTPLTLLNTSRYYGGGCRSYAGGGYRAPYAPYVGGGYCGGMAMPMRSSFGARPGTVMPGCRFIGNPGQ